jgi:hypothetical protein
MCFFNDTRNETGVASTQANGSKNAQGLDIDGVENITVQVVNMDTVVGRALMGVMNVQYELMSVGS